MNGGITLGHFFIGFAVIDLVVIQLMLRSRPSDTEEQRTANRWISIASIALAAGLCAVGLFLPAAQMRLI